MTWCSVLRPAALRASAGAAGRFSVSLWEGTNGGGDPGDGADGTLLGVSWGGDGSKGLKILPEKLENAEAVFLLHDVLRLGCVGPAARDEDMLRCFRGGLLLDSA